ncbi:helix-turn-helix domain-containing protein [Salmonella enterica subsp. enterica serovar Urbana]|nr:hypothetical protein [Salmonella enterica]EBO8547856.1 helix-turn-helix domain-containing protein [Salmonella enterica subsp. enterica serovar Senftenberg]EBP4106276.1 helix-turn-helix domain-containing protein [Salmonella enterica subsp. enterica]EDA2592333.1 helix-turn-helix domain-containing protein [Salmonella enterica subsp. enterica serovar Urbana]EGZ4409861.1 helix-turn-helix domain-containing protein [Salmonella enterica subsp. enterica serovar Poona]
MLLTYVFVPLALRPHKQQKELCRMHESGQYSISDLAELFSVSRPTVYRTLLRGKND